MITDNTYIKAITPTTTTKTVNPNKQNTMYNNNNNTNTNNTNTSHQYMNYPYRFSDVQSRFMSDSSYLSSEKITNQFNTIKVASYTRLLHLFERLLQYHEELLLEQAITHYSMFPPLPSLNPSIKPCIMHFTVVMTFINADLHYIDWIDVPSRLWLVE